MASDASEIRHVGVVGLGLLGADIVALLLSRGLQVTAVDINADAREGLPQRVKAAFAELVEHAGFQHSDFSGWEERLVTGESCKELSGCEFVIESVFEDADLKTKIYSEIENSIENSAPIASNTSGLPISKLQESLQHPERFLGMHFGQPAYAQPFLEIIRGQQTSDAAFDSAHRLALFLGKEPSLLQRDLPGFLINRIAYAMYREAAHLVEEGVSDYESIDNAVRNSLGLFTSLTGPFRWMDISGGPALYGRAMHTIWPTLDNSTKPPQFIQEMIDREDCGTASGKGFYDYETGDAEHWDRIFRDHVWRTLKLRREQEREQNPGK